jgi:hypothetical protein
MGPFDQYGIDTQHPDQMHKNMMREFLRKLDLYPVGITAEDIERLSAALAANHGTPDKMLISHDIYETLKKVTFDEGNLKLHKKKNLKP